MPASATASRNIQSMVDAVGDLARGLQALDPATLPVEVLEAVWTLRGLFGKLFDAELAVPCDDSEAYASDPAVVAAEEAIAAAGAGLLDTLAGVSLPEGLPALAGALRGLLCVGAA